MKTTLVLLLATALSLKAAEPLTVAVLGFDTSDEKSRARAAESAELFAVQLGTKPELWLLERADIDKILGEQTLGLSGLADPAAAVKVGQLLGAKALVTGRILQNDGRRLLVAKIMSTATSRVFGETAGTESELADKVAATLAAQRTAFEPAAVTREQRLARLKETVRGDGRTVVVRVEERELGRQANDPAAQTELEKVLLELGFAVGGPLAGTPDLTILGEAFSEPGARRGQLVSARGRVELRVTNSSGKLLAADSHTATAVDIAEATAGKRALEEAALALFERIAPRLSDLSESSGTSDSYP